MPIDFPSNSGPHSISGEPPLSPASSGSVPKVPLTLNDDHIEVGVKAFNDENPNNTMEFDSLFAVIDVDTQKLVLSDSWKLSDAPVQKIDSLNPGETVTVTEQGGKDWKRSEVEIMGSQPTMSQIKNKKAAFKENAHQGNKLIESMADLEGKIRECEVGLIDISMRLKGHVDEFDGKFLEALQAMDLSPEDEASEGIKMGLEANIEGTREAMNDQNRKLNDLNEKLNVCKKDYDANRVLAPGIEDEFVMSVGRGIGELVKESGLDKDYESIIAQTFHQGSLSLALLGAKKYMEMNLEGGEGEVYLMEPPIEEGSASFHLSIDSETRDLIGVVKKPIYPRLYDDKMGDMIDLGKVDLTATFNYSHNFVEFAVEDKSNQSEY